MYTWISVFTVFLKSRNISFKIKRSKVADYAALSILHFIFTSLYCSNDDTEAGQ